MKILKKNIEGEEGTKPPFLRKLRLFLQIKDFESSLTVLELARNICNYLKNVNFVSQLAKVCFRLVFSENPRPTTFFLLKISHHKFLLII